MKILLAEDDPNLADGLKMLLEKEHFNVDVVNNEEMTLAYRESKDYGVLILDMHCSRNNEFSIVKEVRKANDKTPILLLSYHNEVKYRVAGLNAGADDYMSKPFSAMEFIARVRALARRSPLLQDEVIEFGNVKLNCSSFELDVNQNQFTLNNKEFQLMELFMRYPHNVFSTSHLMDMVWKKEASIDEDVVWTYIGFIRRKLKKGKADIEIKNIRGAGYCLKECD